MIGMGFAAFLTLLVISAILSAIFQGVGYRVLDGSEGFFAKLITGWVGGWIGSPVLGYWGGRGIFGTNVHLIPAILGSLAAIFMQVLVVRLVTGYTLTRATPVRPTEEKRVA